MNAHLVTFYVGTERNDAPAVDDQLGAIEKARHSIASTFGGFTETYAVGGWMAGHVVSELTLKWEAVTESASVHDEARHIAEDLRGLFNQQAVLYTISPVISGMVEE